MFFISSAVVSASITVPVVIMSLSDILRSKMTRAPVFVFDICSQAMTVWVIADSRVDFSFSLAENSPYSLLLPTLASSFLSSGWKMITSAISPISTALRSRKFIIVRLSTLESQRATRSMSMPFARLEELVFLTSLITS